MKLNWQRSGGGIQRDEGVQRVDEIPSVEKV